MVMVFVSPASMVPGPEIANLLGAPAETATLTPVEPEMLTPPMVPVMVAVPMESAVNEAEYVPLLLSVTVPTAVPSREDDNVTVSPPVVSALPKPSFAETVTVTDPSVVMVELETAIVVWVASAAPGEKVTVLSCAPGMAVRTPPEGVTLAETVVAPIDVDASFAVYWPSDV
jgi:hypothetical protein